MDDEDRCRGARRQARVPSVRGRRMPVSARWGLALLAVLSGCGSGPTEDQMLPAKDLAFPGSTETFRIFEPEHHGRKIDGGTIDDPARLRRKFRTAPEVAFEQVRSWYRDELERQGWHVADFPPGQEHLELTRNADRLDHRFVVERVGTDPTYEVTYSLRNASG
jgi:hypothetical protein